MTEAEFVGLRDQVAQLQQELASRTESWRKLGVVSAGIAIFMAVAALGFLGVSMWLDAKDFPTSHAFAMTTSHQLILLLIPLGLLTQALRSR